MKRSLRRGFSFGTTSGIITTLGLIVGLYTSTQLRLAVIGGIIAIAIADAFSDALGMHVSVEAEKHTIKEIWESTAATFIAKFLFALTFIIPIFILEFSTAILASVVWGLLVLAFVSYKVAKMRKAKPWKAITEHLSIAFLVIIVTYYVGRWILLTFSGA